MNKPRIIKICGMTDSALAAETVAMGAHYIGVMMYPASKRYVDVATAKKIARAVKNANGIPVAVFVDTSAEDMKALCETCDIQVVQLHGEISRQAHHHLPNSYQRIYVLSVREDGSINPDTADGLTYLKPDRDLLLFDGLNGGSGHAFNHDKFHYDGNIPFILAGGLTAENVSTAINKIHPHGIDVSSGVESSPGVKSKPLIHQFITNAKQSLTHAKPIK